MNSREQAFVPGQRALHAVACVTVIGALGGPLSAGSGQDPAESVAPPATAPASAVDRAGHSSAPVAALRSPSGKCSTTAPPPAGATATRSAKASVPSSR